VLLDSEIIADRVVLEHLQNLLNSHGDKSLFSEQGSLREWLTDSSGQDDAGILKKFSMFTNIPPPTDSLKQLEHNLKHALSKEVRAIKGMEELLKSIKGSGWWHPTVPSHDLEYHWVGQKCWISAGLGFLARKWSKGPNPPQTLTFTSPQNSAFP
jgi:beta-phosphoglucomutase-like phosphatase (HAD superfamily)